MDLISKLHCNIKAILPSYIFYSNRFVYKIQTTFKVLHLITHYEKKNYKKNQNTWLSIGSTISSCKNLTRTNAFSFKMLSRY